MLSAALWLPADRLEAASRRDVPEPTPEAPSSGPRFADLLQQRRADAAPPPATGATSAPAPAESKPSSKPSTTEEPAAAARPARSGLRPSAARQIRDVEPPDAAAGDDRRGTDATGQPGAGAADATEGAAKPAASHGDASAGPGAPPLAVPASLDPALRAAASGPAAEGGTNGDGAAAGLSPRVATSAGVPGREPPKSATEDIRDAAAPSPTPPVEAQIAVAAAAGEAKRPASVVRETAPPLPGPALPMAPCSPDLHALPPPVVALPTPLHAPDFAQTLGAQVSVFARDGLQQAELRINPPEMGPIGVQIEIDGRDARVNFHAGMAATREVLERALPELAAALRSEGLTLAGGGVFDGSASARQPSRDQAAGGAPRGGGTGDDMPSGRPPGQPLRAAQGVLDLYA